jgi:hypothetical protein
VSLACPACLFVVAWWAQQGLNLRLAPCEDATLPLSYVPGSGLHSKNEVSLEADTQPKRRGRPKGSRNAPALFKPILTPPADEVKGDYKHADIDTIIARQLSMVDWAQQATRNEMMRAYQAKGLSVQVADIERLTALSTAIMRSVDALKKSSDLASELASRMTPEQLLEAALAKIEGQDIKTLRYAIRRLRAYVDRLGPVTSRDKAELGENSLPAFAASRTIAALEDE